MREGLAALLRGAGFVIAGLAALPGELDLQSGGLAPGVVLVGIAAGVQEGPAQLEEVLRWRPSARVLVFADDGCPQESAASRVGGAAGHLSRTRTSPADLFEAVRRVAEGERVFPSEPAPPAVPALAALTPRQREVLRQLAEGSDNLKIAALLDITEATVKSHVGALYRKLGVENRVELALLGRGPGQGT